MSNIPSFRVRALFCLLFIPLFAAHARAQGRPEAPFHPYQVEEVPSASVGKRFPGDLLSSATRTLVGHAGIVWAARFSPDGKFIASTGSDRTVRIWDLAAGKQIKSLPGATSSMMCLAWSPDGRLVVAGGRSGVIHVWDVQSARLIATFHGHTGPVLNVAFSDAGRKVLSTSHDHTYRIWSLSSHKQLFVGSCEDQVEALAVSADGTRAIVGSLDHSARIINANTGETLIDIPGTSGMVHTVSWADHDRLALIYQEQAPTIVYDVPARRQVCTLETSPFPTRSSATPDGQLAVATYGVHVSLWSPIKGELFGELRGPANMVIDTDISPDGRYVLATGGADMNDAPYMPREGDPRIYIWDLHADQFVETKLPLQAATFSSDGTHGACAEADGSLLVYDTVTARPIAHLATLGSPVRSLSFNASCSQLLCACADDSVRIVDIAANKVTATTKVDGALSMAKWAGKAALLLAGDKALFWDTTNPPHELATSVTAIATSDDGKFLLTGGADGRGILWNGSSREKIQSFDQIHGRPIDAAAVLRDNRSILLHNSCYGYVLFDIDSGLPTHELPTGWPILDICSTPQPGKLLAIGASPSFYLFDPAVNRELVQFHEQVGPALAATIPPPGKSLLTVSMFGGIRSRPFHPPIELKGGSIAIYSMAVAPDNKTGACQDGPVKIINLDDGALLRTIPIKGINGGCAFSADGKRLAAGAGNNAILIDVASGKILDTLVGPPKVFSRLACSPDASLLATDDYLSRDGPVYLWNLRTGEALGTIPPDPRCKCIISYSWSPDGKRLIVCSGLPNGTAMQSVARVIDVASKSVRHVFPFSDRDVAGAWFTPDGNDILLLDPLGSVLIFDARTYALRNISSFHGAMYGIASGHMSTDGRFITALDNDSHVVVWDRTTTTIVAHGVADYADYLTLPFFPDGKLTLWRWAMQSVGRIWQPNLLSGGSR